MNHFILNTSEITNYRRFLPYLIFLKMVTMVRIFSSSLYKIHTTFDIHSINANTFEHTIFLSSDDNDYNYDYDDPSNHSYNSSDEIEYTPSKDRDINRNGEVQTSGFYASQNADHDLRHNMPLYTGYFSDNLEEDLNSQKLRYENI